MGEAPLGAASGGARGNRPTARRDCWAAMTLFDERRRRVNEIFSALEKSCVDCESNESAQECTRRDRETHGLHTDGQVDMRLVSV